MAAGTQFLSRDLVDSSYFILVRQEQAFVQLCPTPNINLKEEHHQSYLVILLELFRPLSPKKAMMCTPTLHTVCLNLN